MSNIDINNSTVSNTPLLSSVEKQKSSRNKKVYSMAGVGAFLLISVAVTIPLCYIYLKKKGSGKDHHDTALCYAAPTCVYTSPSYDPANGFTNYTGWSTNGDGDASSYFITANYTASSSCCDICNTAPPTRRGESALPSLSSSASAGAYFYSSGVEGDGRRAVVDVVTQRVGEHTFELTPLSSSSTSSSVGYDFLLLDTIWLPQFCRALSIGHDPTLAHTYGTVCDPSVLASPPRLTIHGLWPNLWKGYEVCCTANNPHTVNPFTLAAEMDRSYPTDVMPLSGANGTYRELLEKWRDPTFPLAAAADGDEYDEDASQGKIAADCSTCYLHNHEWQKHGSCFSPAPSNTSDSVGKEPSPKEKKKKPSDQVLYFKSGLYLYNYQSAIYDSLHSLNGTVVNATERIQSLFPTKMLAVCDKLDAYNKSTTIGTLLELRVCFLPVANVSVVTDGGASVPLATHEDQRRYGLDTLVLPNGLQVVPMDCPDDGPSAFTVPCPELVYVANF